MVYDCFTFFNELDLLEIRLNELSEVVDKFVLVEATKTHQGKDKPLHFSENKSRFEKFQNRIIHIIVDEYPAYEGKSAWLLEHHQRDMIMKGLQQCKSEDIILISDVDEIPSPEKITQFKNHRGIKIFKQRMFYYYLNCVNAGTGDSSYSWHGSIMVNYSSSLQPQYLRGLGMTLMGSYRKNLSQRIYWGIWKLRNIYFKGQSLCYVENGGWHFSYLGGVETIIRKLEAFAHTEYNKLEYKDPAKISEAIKSGKDIFGRNFNYKYIPIDDTYPRYIINNLDSLKRLIKLQTP